MGGSTLIWHPLSLLFIMLVDQCIPHPFWILDWRQLPAMMIGASIVPFIWDIPDSTVTRSIWSISWVPAGTGNDDRCVDYPFCMRRPWSVVSRGLWSWLIDWVPVGYWWWWLVHHSSLLFKVALLLAKSDQSLECRRYQWNGFDGFIKGLSLSTCTWVQIAPIYYK